MQIGNCVWNEGVLQAILADSPAEVPAWAYGYRGAGESYMVAGGTPHASVRPDEATNIVPLHPDGFALSFHHTNGRPYAAYEQLGVRLSGGDWLEFELDALPDAADPMLVDAEGQKQPSHIVRTARGLRVSATHDVLAARLVIR